MAQLAQGAADADTSQQMVEYAYALMLWGLYDEKTTPSGQRASVWDGAAGTYVSVWVPVWTVEDDALVIHLGNHGIDWHVVTLLLNVLEESVAELGKAAVFTADAVRDRYAELCKAGALGTVDELLLSSAMQLQ